MLVRSCGSVQRSHLGKTQVRHWHKLFKLGGLDASANDAKKSGWPRSACTDENIDLIRQLVDEDCCKTVRELVVQSGLTQGTVHRILKKELKLTRICAKFVPRLLTEQKDHRARLCADNLSSLDDGGRFFIEQIISGDETWLYCFDPESKQHSSQWHPKGGTRPLKALRSKTAGKKVMLTLFFDSEGPILIHFLPKGETIDSDVYCEILAQLREAIRVKCPGMWRMIAEEDRRSFLLHHDNVTPHTSSITLAAIGSNHIHMVPHPAYSPDLALADFSVFPNLKEELHGYVFRNVEELKADTRCILLGWPKDFWRRSIWDMAKLWAKCVAAGGEYFEGCRLDIFPLPTFLDHSEDDWSDEETEVESD